MRPRSGWLWDILILNACSTAYAAFNFQWTEPTECGTMNVTWSGGVPPYSLLIVPEHSEEITYQIHDWIDSTFSFQLPLPKDTRMIMTMSDYAGFASAGISGIVEVGASTGATCNQMGVAAVTFTTHELLEQCQPFYISGYSGVVYPVTLRGFVPGGTVLALTSNGDAVEWNANVRAGTLMIFSLTDGSGRPGGTSAILTVANSIDTGCFDANSPSSTSSSPATTTSSTPPSSSSSSTSSSSSSVAPTSSSTPPTSNSTPRGSELTPPTSSSPPTSTQSTSPSSSALAASGLSRNTLVAVVVGTAVGGLVVLAAVWFLVRCRRKESRDAEIVDLADDPPTPTPGTYEPGPYSPRGSASFKHVSTISTPWTPPGASDLDAAGSSQPSAAAAAAAAGPSLTRELSATPASMPTTYTVHTDAEDARRDVVELPPQYDERRSSGLLDVPNSAHVDGVLQSPTMTPSEKNALVGSPPHEPMI